MISDLTHLAAKIPDERELEEDLHRLIAEIEDFRRVTQRLENETLLRQQADPQLLRALDLELFAKPD